MPKKPKQPEWYLVDGVARVWDGESWLSYKWTEPKGWYEFQGEEYYWDGKEWYAEAEDEDEDEDEDEEYSVDVEKTAGNLFMGNKSVDFSSNYKSRNSIGMVEKVDTTQADEIIEDLLLITFEIESHLDAVQAAFQENQLAGEILRDKIVNIRSKGQEISLKLDNQMNSITCLREWHWNYIERYERFIYEAKSTFLQCQELKNNSGLFMKSKRSKVFQYATDLCLLGQTYISTNGNVFDGNYSSLIPGPEIRTEALKLMSQRLAAARNIRGN